MNGYTTTWGWHDEAARFTTSANTITWSPSTLTVNCINVRSQNPPDADEGGAGVREPRRPLPPSPTSSVALIF